jgi:hypothetical protein
VHEGGALFFVGDIVDRQFWLPRSGRENCRKLLHALLITQILKEDYSDFPYFSMYLWNRVLIGVIRDFWNVSESSRNAMGLACPPHLCAGARLLGAGTLCISRRKRRER